MGDIYSTISTRRTPQLEQADARQAPNNAGGYTFQLDPLAQAKRFLILGTDAGTYYQDAPTLTRETAAVIMALAERDGPALVELIVDVSVGGKAPRQQPALFALAIASAAGDEQTRKAAYAALPQVARTGTALFQFAGYREQFAGWSRGLRSAVARWYTEPPVERVAYQAVKYRQREGWSHRDLLRLAHPKTTEPARKALFDWISGRLPEDTVPGIVVGYQQAQVPGYNVPEIVRAHRLPWEALPDEALAQRETWDALLDVGMPQTALLRQLPRLTRLGIIAPFGGRTAEIAAQLIDPERLQRARVHPLAVLTALKTYAAGHGRGSEWQPVTAIVDALDEAFYAAFAAVEPAGKRTLIGLDVSGSMDMARDPSGLLTAREVGAAMALVVASTEPEAGSDVYGFTAGGGSGLGWYGRRQAAFTPLNISRKQRLDDIIERTRRLPFGGTDCALPMLEATRHGWAVDTFVVITDNETWAGDVHPHQALRQYRQQSGIDAKLVVLAVTPTRFTIADPTDAGMLDVVGFGTDVPQLVTEFSRGF